MDEIQFLDITNQDYFEEYFWDENDLLVPSNYIQISNETYQLENQNV